MRTWSLPMVAVMEPDWSIGMYGSALDLCRGGPGCLHSTRAGGWKQPPCRVSAATRRGSPFLITGAAENSTDVGYATTIQLP